MKKFIAIVVAIAAGALVFSKVRSIRSETRPLARGHHQLTDGTTLPLERVASSVRTGT